MTTWVQDQPLWVHEALRRISKKGSLDADDHEELAHVCLGEPIQVGGATIHSPPEDEIEAEEVDPDFSPESQGPSSWALRAVCEPSGVNLLDSSAELAFEEEGLTVVFGLNGSGKSGYARIIASACGARGNRGPILPNVYESHPPDEPSATIHVSPLDQAGQADAANGDADDEEEDVDQIGWSGELVDDERIQRIAFFDECVADFYLEQTHGPRYMPAILQTLSELAATHDALRGLLEDKEDLLPAPLDLEVQEEFSALTPIVERGVEGRNPELLSTIALYGDEHLPTTTVLEGRVEDLREEETGEGPNSLENQIAALETFLEETRPLLASLTSGFLATAEAAREKHRAAEQAAEVAATGEIDESRLEGVGGEAWRKLWKAASEFSENEAYEEEAFPYLDGDARCVLCHQPLSEDAIERFRSFNDYMEQVTSDHLQHTERLLDSLHHAAHTTSPSGASLDHVLEAVSKALPYSKEEIEGTIERWISKVNALETALDDVDEDLPEPADWDLYFEASALLETKRARLEEIEETTQEASPTLELAEARVARAEERETLDKVLPSLLKELERREAADLLAEKKATTNTASLTHLVKELGEQVLTDTLEEAFENTMEALGLDTIEPQFESAGGKKGKRVHQVALDSQQEAEIRDVASEGEQKAIALATFLTELATGSGSVPLVLDDPISSLDHRWSHRVAERIVEESQQRQVIVFTHRVTFVQNLETAAEKQDVPLSKKVLQRKPKATGIVQETPSWDLAGVKDRASRLNRRLNELEQERDEITDPEMRREIASIYSELRDAWERAVEEVLLGRVVQRYSPRVQTRRLSSVLKAEESDVDLIDEQMTLCSEMTEAHSTPLPQGPKTRPLEDVREDIKTLSEWAKEYRKRDPP